MRTKNERIAELLTELLILIFPEQPSRSTAQTTVKTSQTPLRTPKKQPKGTLVECTKCHEQKPKFCKGMCRTCYKTEWLANKVKNEPAAPIKPEPDVKKN